MTPCCECGDGPSFRISYNVGDTNERSTPIEPSELEKEQRQQVDTVYDIDIHRPISIDVVVGQPLDVGDYIKVIDSS
ncbi:hypothetical protein [Exiguobacterium artemiae]|uniref:hypothetical protein n=1 Tax=Exiguobacterium artemiae TaxID=340145 RepID=UPI003D090305